MDFPSPDTRSSRNDDASRRARSDTRCLEPGETVNSERDAESRATDRSPSETPGILDRMCGGAVSWWGLVGLLGLVVAVYWPVLSFEFVNWDDPWYVLKNPLITSWHPSNLWRIVTEISVKNYAPLTTLSLLVDHTLFGLNAGGYHFTNVLLHAANAVLVCMLVARLTASRSIGLVTAVLFAVHPVQIETVAWVSSRKTLLCGTFMLASGLCWLRPERTPKQELWGTLWLAAALLAKAAAIILPPIVLAYDMLVRRKTLAEALPRQLVSGFLCLMLLNVTMSAQVMEMGGVRGHLGLSKLHILAVDGVILWKYVGLLLWPSQLSVLYDPPTQGILVPMLLSMTAWGVVAIGCWRMRDRSPLMAWAAVTWLLLLFPVLNLFPITTLMNDRYLYLPSLCVFGLAAGAMAKMPYVVRSPRVIAVGAGACVFATVLIYTGMAMSRLPVWHDDFALWSDTVTKSPQLPVVQIQWADALHRTGETERAIGVLQKILVDGAADEGDRKRIERRLSEWSS